MRIDRTTAPRLFARIVAPVGLCLLAACTHAAHQAPALTGDAAGIAKARADSVRWPYTAADIRFMSDMTHHHAQAIRMAGWAPTHGASDAVLRLSARIVNAQTDEINIIKQWLRDRRQPEPNPNPEGVKMMMGGMEHTMLMPGMLSAEQMQQLDSARGPEFDRLFLTYMIQHHRGAVTMVKELFDTNGAAQDETVFKFASDVNVDQTTEINRMLQMLLGIGTSGRQQ